MYILDVTVPHFMRLTPLRDFAAQSTLLAVNGLNVYAKAEDHAVIKTKSIGRERLRIVELL